MKPPAFVPPDHTEHPERNKDCRKGRKRDFLDYLGFGISVGTLIFVGRDTHLTGLLVADNDRLAENSNTQIEADARAWIAPTGAHLRGDMIEGQPIDALVDFSNPGRTPALNVVHFAHGGITLPVSAEELDTQLKLGPQVPSAIDACASAIPIDGRPVIYPATVQHQAAAIDKNFVVDDAIINRKRVFFIHGCFGYETMGKVHYSRYCFWLSMDPDPITGKPVFRPCIVGNRAD